MGLTTIHLQHCRKTALRHFPDAHHPADQELVVAT